MAGVLTQEECAEPKLEPKKEMTARGVVTGERVLVLEHSQTELRETPKTQGMLRAGKGVEDRLVCSCRQYGPKCFCAGDFEGQALVSRPRTEETNEEGRDQAPWALPICPRAVPSRSFATASRDGRSHRRHSSIFSRALLAHVLLALLEPSEMPVPGGHRWHKWSASTVGPHHGIWAKVDPAHSFRRGHTHHNNVVYAGISEAFAWHAMQVASSSFRAFASPSPSHRIPHATTCRRTAGAAASFQA